LFLSVAGDRTHIGTYVGVSPSPASNGNNFFVSKLSRRWWDPQIFKFSLKIKIWELSTVLLENHCI